MNVRGIIFTHDASLGDLTHKRTMASLPFGGRYRQVDFALSNLSCAGVRHVGIISRYNYQSLMNHIGDGEEWGLELEEGGLEFLTPYAISTTYNYRGKLESLNNAKTFLKYGGDEELSASARLILDKANLEKLGKIKIAADDNRPLFDISQTGNTGTIKAGGLIVPYTIASAIGSSKLAYGDPMSYLLALFGSYTVRVDESVKSVERMIAILGDVMVGGNLVMDKGMLIANLT